MEPQLHIVRRGERVEQVRVLFQAYAESLNFALCFQHFEQELASLPGDYSVPAGCLLLAHMGGQPAGCVGVRRLAKNTCEIKRLYVVPEFRGQSLGRALARRAMDEAARAGYRRICLDTLPSMRAARSLYRSLGFRVRVPHHGRTLDGIQFMEAPLD